MGISVCHRHWIFLYHQVPRSGPTGRTNILERPKIRVRVCRFLPINWGKKYVNCINSDGCQWATAVQSTCETEHIAWIWPCHPYNWYKWSILYCLVFFYFPIQLFKKNRTDIVLGWSSRKYFPFCWEFKKT